MAYVVDDTRSITIYMTVPEGLAAISAIRAPAEANAGETVPIEVDVINNGGTDTIFVELVPTPAVTILPSAMLEATVNSGATQTYAFSFVMPSSNVSFTISAGHVG